MKKVLVLVCVLVMSVVAFGQKKKTADAGAMKASEYVGTWKLDPAETKDPEWKSATLTITKDTDDTFAYRMSGVGKDGKKFNHMVSVKKGEEQTQKDGTKLQFNTDRSFMVKDTDGSHADLKMSVSDDHKTMTVDGKGTDKDGKDHDVHDVWKRAGGMKKAAAKKPSTEAKS